MLKRGFLSALVVALTVGAGIVPAHSQDERACVSQREYGEVQVGWRQARVADHFDIPGRKIGYSEPVAFMGVETVWMYRKCSAWGPGGSYVGVGYGNRDNGWSNRYMRVWGKVPDHPEQLLSRFGDWSIAPAQPDGGRSCVTQREYRDVRARRYFYGRVGWPQVRVTDHFDTRGVIAMYYYWDGEDDWPVWKYRKCSTWGPGGRYVGILYALSDDGSRYVVEEKVPSNPNQLLRGVL